MPTKKKVAWYEKLGVKYDNVTEKGNVVCKKLSKKDLAAVKAAGFKVTRIPNGSFVIHHQ